MGIQGVRNGNSEMRNGNQEYLHPTSHMASEKWEMGLKWESPFLKYPPLVGHPRIDLCFRSCIGRAACVSWTREFYYINHVLSPRGARCCNSAAPIHEWSVCRYGGGHNVPAICWDQEIINYLTAMIGSNHQLNSCWPSLFNESLYINSIRMI